MLDGYDELPPEMQEKILRALKNGHVDDSEWKGVCLAPVIAQEVTESGFLRPEVIV